MAAQSRHVSIAIAAPAAEVYDYAADPTRLPSWAAGLAGGAVVRVGDEWHVDSPMGRVSVRFVDTNDLGVLDHVVTLPSGEQVYNPMRVIPDGDGCEVVFTVRRREGMTDLEFDADTRAVATDLGTLRSRTERI